MSILQRIADPWLEWIVAVSWQLALLVCIVAVVCRLARGASPRWRSACGSSCWRRSSCRQA